MDEKEEKITLPWMNLIRTLEKAKLTNTAILRHLKEYGNNEETRITKTINQKWQNNKTEQYD